MELYSLSASISDGSWLQDISDKYLPNVPAMKPTSQQSMNRVYVHLLGKEGSTPSDKTEFRSMLGTVVQLTNVWPDIAFEISKISQRQVDPRAKDERALLYLMNYLYYSRNRGVVLCRSLLLIAMS